MYGEKVYKQIFITFGAFLCALSCYIYPSVLSSHQLKKYWLRIQSVMVFIKNKILNDTKNVF